MKTTLGLEAPPEGCPLGPCYARAPPLVHRAVNALGAMDDGLSDRHAFGGRVLAVDVTCLAIARRARHARDRSDALHRERARAAEEAARAARTKPS